MNKKTAAMIAGLEIELAQLEARMAEMDEEVGAGTKSAAEVDEAYYAAYCRTREIADLIKEAAGPRHKICPNTAALVAANID